MTGPGESQDTDQETREAAQQVQRESDTELDSVRDVEPVNLPNREDENTVIPLDDEPPRTDAQSGSLR